MATRLKFHLTLSMLVCTSVLSQNSLKENNINGDENTCPDNFFPCYDDCCKTGEMFCHSKDKRCHSCETRQVLCGNDSLPIECLLYCYLLQHPTNSQAEICLDRTYFIAVTTTVACLFIICVGVIVALCGVVRRSVDKWPVFIRKIFCVRLTDNDAPEDTVTKGTEENACQQHMSCDPKEPLLPDGSSASHSRKPSDSSQKSVNVKDLNLRTMQDVNGGQEASSNPQGPTNGDAKDAWNSTKGQGGAQPEISGNGSTRGGQDNDIAEGRRTPNQASSREGTTDHDQLPTDQTIRPQNSRLENEASSSCPHDGSAAVQAFDVKKQGFSMMNPTNHPHEQQQKPVVTTGTRNPVEKFCTQVL